MQTSLEPGSGRNLPTRRWRWWWLIVAGGLLVLLIPFFLHRPTEEPPDSEAAAKARAGLWVATSSARRESPGGRGRWTVPPGLTAEQIVTNKLAQFARNRREVLRKFAEKLKVQVPPQFDQFFDAVENGRFDEARDLFKSYEKLREDPSIAEAVNKLWPVVHETFGVAEVAHNWPAQQLLDYGQAILGSLRPDMVYVGGTDSGRFIPTLLNETSEGDRHIVLTQNALADSSYLKYLEFLYADRFNALTGDDSQKGFVDYTTDAQKRLSHDEQFPNEPRQIRPGEDIRLADGRMQISGQMAVMAINENLLQALMGKNPNLTFAIEQSFVMQSTLPQATVLGPIMELGVKDAQNGLTPERAADSVDYWRATSQQLLSDLSAKDSPETRQAWSKMASDQAQLLLNRNYASQAEDTFRIANQLCPGNPEVVFNYIQLLTQQNRIQDAIPIVEGAVKASPDNAQLSQLLQQLKQTKRN